MKIGFVGLGKMGANMVERLINNDHELVVYDRSQERTRAAVKKGATDAESLNDLLTKLPERKVVWMMVPAGHPVVETIDELRDGMKPGDVIVDGGNSNWRESHTRHLMLHDMGVHYIDCGVSGGVWGLKNGYCLMYGGDKDACNYLEPVFKSLAPENGYLYCGPSGAGHFVKMVHNGIEYGMMQAYAEGFEIMEKSNDYEIDLRAVSKLWQHGSVIRSWVLELAELAFAEDPRLERLQDYVSDSGEGRWTVQTAIDFDVPAPIITLSLLTRLRSRQEESFGNKVLAALRNQFGGHSVKTK